MSILSSESTFYHLERIFLILQNIYFYTILYKKFFCLFKNSQIYQKKVF